MEIGYEKEANISYVYLKEIRAGEVAKTVSLEDSVNMDLDKEGKTRDIEILNVSKNILLGAINSATITD